MVNQAQPPQLVELLFQEQMNKHFLRQLIKRLLKVFGFVEGLFR
jgi:hypothetical protein